MSWTQGRTLYRTRTGRAKPNGKTTRRSQSVRQTKYVKGKGQDRPLPLDMACHPQALTRTPLHPGCDTDMSSCNVHQWAELTVTDFCEGLGLQHIPYPELWEVRWPSGENLGYAQPSEGLSYVRAAANMGIRLELVQR